MWPELLSTNLGLTYVAANNYARGGSSISDMIHQVTSFPAPAKPELSLYCFWINTDGANYAPEDVPKNLGSSGSRVGRFCEE